MRVAKAIAHAGLCSRRDAERWIGEGRVAVNGTVLKKPAHVVSPDDKITVDGKPLPKAEAPRLWRYRVRAHGRVTQADLDRLAKGITIDGVHYGPVEAKIDREQGSNVWLTLGLREGKNREVKRLAEALGLTVNRLIRISFGPFALGDLPVGEVEEVKQRVLKDQLGAKLTGELGLSSENQRLRAARRR